MQVFLKRLLQHREKLSQLEKQVLEYILRNPERVVRLNLDELSKEIFVSTATISRTCQQLGFRGFQDLKYELSKNMAQAPQTSISPPSYLLSKHMERVKHEMERTLEYIDEEKIKKAAEYIDQSTHVELFGVGNSLPVCVDAARKLMFSGKICNAREDWDELRSVANSLNENDLAILVSYSGETLHMLEYAHILKRRNVKTIAITGRHNNRLQQEVDLSLQAYITNCYYDELDMCSRFPLSIILDFIIITYLNLNKQTGK
jgi:DNA-binding MurR/RpiR family transcriptional regulator